MRDSRITRWRLKSVILALHRIAVVLRRHPMRLTTYIPFAIIVAMMFPSHGVAQTHHFCVAFPSASMPAISRLTGTMDQRHTRIHLYCRRAVGGFSLA